MFYLSERIERSLAGTLVSQIPLCKTRSLSFLLGIPNAGSSYLDNGIMVPVVSVQGNTERCSGTRQQRLQ